MVALVQGPAQSLRSPSLSAALVLLVHPVRRVARQVLKVNWLHRLYRPFRDWPDRSCWPYWPNR